MKKYDVAIIGGGASGLAAAIELKMLNADISVAIIEKNDALGRKIRATGNGRCNITNKNANGYLEIMKWLLKVGIMTRSCDGDLVYPYSESAADVVELLIDRVNELGVDVILNATVTDVEKNNSGFTIKYGHGTIDAAKVVLAVGGKAGPAFGTTGDGYAIARKLGHTVVTPIPVLTSVECEEWDKEARPSASSLAGVRARGVVSLYSEGSKLFEEAGEIQFTKYGLSGICIFNMTRFMRYNRAEGEELDQFKISLNLFPEGDISELMSVTGTEGRDALRTVVKKELADYVMAHGIESIHNLTFTPSAIRGWKDAQATAGGVDLGEIDPETCESRLNEGLFITGELLDYDGPCGGYNLSNAWLTGLKAARAIAE
ncbi:MAG: aminoacetone oxidase family FAD-binding enzyme [Clostridiales bacterium]|nr:aminoacetone oxidase family FAD-binding enzyme [Candidatus Crickella equi]